MSSIQPKLANQVAVVTGASKGIGAAIAQSLAAAGASVVVNYASSKEGAEKIVAKIVAQGGKAIAIKADVSKQAEVEKLFAETKRVYGRLDVLVNNAGIYAFGPIEAVTEEFFRKYFDVNVLGLLLTIKESLKLFGPEGGSIVNISSAVTRITPAYSSVYTATKGAVDAITGSLAKELAARKIRVNAILPGMIETEGVTTAGFLGTDFEKGIVATAPLGRIGQTDDIAPAAVFLASSDSKYMTGESLVISGGLR
jgi:3-oxoacyl-[acyl-carrier protein] reductase